VLVRVIVPEQSDVKLVQWATRHFYEYLLKRGIRIYERQDRMLHSKAMVIDGQWSVIGSCNLDPRSLRLNLEFFAVIHAPQVAARADRHYVISKDALDVQYGNTARLRAKLREAESRVAKTVIRAPFAGIIGLRQVSPGAYVKAGSDIVRLENVSSIKVDFRISENYLSKVRSNQDISVHLDAFPGEEFKGRVYAVEPVVDEKTRTIAMRARIPNRGFKLKPGMFVRVAVTLENRPNAVIVPETAIWPQGRDSFVYRVVDGKAVRLVQGQAGSETEYGSALDAAMTWQRDGAEWIHLVDLDAAFGRGSNAPLLAEVIAKLAAAVPPSAETGQPSVAVELSGGIRDEAALAAALSTGCERVIIGTAALENPAWVRDVIARHGERIAVGLDVRGDRLAARGWTADGGDLLAVLARLEADGCPRYVVTDVTKDGMLRGPNTGLLRQVCARTQRPVIASGGVSSLADLAAIAALRPLGVEGAIVGKALYAGAFTLQQALAAVRQ
jgi:phosphoribosylanthranilate isomerase